MSSGYIVRQLQADDAQAYAAFRHAALLDEPLAFAASPEDDPACSPDGVREYIRKGPNSMILGAFQNELVGIVGIDRDRQRKASHKAHVWGIYVAANHRRRGVAFQLLSAAVQHARTLPGATMLHLGVSSTTPGAQRLYEQLGFRVWGAEPDALKHEGQTIIEYHMALRL